jgi:hypothetical protein
MHCYVLPAPQGASLHVLTSVAKGSSSACQLDAVSIAIIEGASTGTNEPDTTKVLHSVKVNVPGSTPFTWTGNTSQVVSLDFVDLNDGASGVGDNTGVVVTPGKTYWLRVKFFAPYTPAAGSK